MTVSINTFQDILHALEQEPSLRDELRRHLLSEDLLHLPVLLAQHMTDFAEFVRLTREHNEITNRRLERLEGDVAELKDGQVRLEGDVAGLKGDVAELKDGQARLEGDVAGLKDDVAELKDGQARLEGDVAGLKGDVAELKDGQARLEGDVAGLKDDVAGLKDGQARLEGDVAGLKDDVAGLKDGQARLEGDVAGLKDDVAGLKGDVAELKDGQARLEGDVAGLKGDVAELKDGQARLEGDVAGLKDGQARLEGDVAGLKTTVGAMEGNMTELKTTVGAMGGNVSQLVGRNYEAHAARIGSRRLRKRMNLENARAVTHPPHGDPSFLTEIANSAEKNGVITSEQADDLEQGDLVFTSADANGTQFYILAEVSLTVQKSDAERARRRAAILEQATGIATTPITIGELIASDAEEETVVFIAIPRAQE